MCMVWGSVCSAGEICPSLPRKPPPHTQLELWAPFLDIQSILRAKYPQPMGAAQDERFLDAFPLPAPSEGGGQSLCPVTFP